MSDDETVDESHAQYYPEHERTSCSDSEPCNAEAGGSFGCARCTALAMDVADQDRRDAARYRWLRDAGDSTWRPFGRRYGYSAAWADAEIDKAMSVAAQESKS